MSQKYTVVHFFENQTQGLNFPAKEWPLHSTLLDIFTLHQPLYVLQAELQSIARTTEPFNIEATGETMFGTNHDIAVTLLAKDPALLELHEKLSALTEAASLTFDHPEFVGTGFIPHASIQSSGKLIIGKSYRISHISLVDMYPDENISRRAIMSTYYFS
jgi:hypothetical protein